MLFANMSPQDDLMRLIWKFHSLLNTAWPKPGVEAPISATVFLNTKLFAALEQGVHEIQSTINRFASEDTNDELSQFWSAFVDLFKKVKGQKTSTEPKKVDAAVNLLYLAS